MNAKEREIEFRAAIKAVCDEFGAIINITDDGKPYGMHNAVMVVDIDGEIDSEGNIVHEYSSFEW